MITLIIGGSGSGKSAYAEQYTVQISGDSRKYYLATMQVSDREGQVKVDRHRKLRSGKGFITIEQPLSIYKVLEKMEALENDFIQEKSYKIESIENKESKKKLQIKDKYVLLECISNLTANEMFSGEVAKSCDEVTDKIIKEIKILNTELKHLVIVTNNVFEDGIVYDKTTMEYIRAMGSINESLAVIADRVVEVVVGIPLIIKESDIVG